MATRPGLGSSQRFGQGSFGRDSSTSSSGGWGKQATKRFNTSEFFKKDPLLKSLQGKIAVGFGDYKPWQRTNLPRYVPPIKASEAGKAKKLQSRPLSSHTTHSTFSVGKSKGGGDSDRPQSAMTLHTQCSSVCLHPWLKKPVLTPINTYDKKNRKNISLLKMQIKLRQKTLEEYQKRKAKLIEHNFSFQDKIEVSETNVHNDVKKLLEKYDRFRGALDTLNKTFDEDLAVAKRSLASTKTKVAKDIQELQHELQLMDAKLQKKLMEVKVLLNYKDKEYPEKALEISRLKRKKEILHVAFKEELEELNAVIDAETNKFSVNTKTTEETIRAQVAEETIASLKQNIKDMALQNEIMKKEITIHENEIKLLETRNSQLEKEIEILLKSPDLNTRAHLFPDVFGERVKCTPDMDVVLDIPTQEWLPI